MRRSSTLRERALGLLARREHSRAELAAKLKARGLSEDGLEALLEELTRRKLLSQERYAESRARALSRKFGAARIVHELRAKGVGKGLAERSSAAARATETARARDIWRKKFGVPPQTPEERAKQARFLRSRGFSFDAIRSVVRGIEED